MKHTWIAYTVTGVIAAVAGVAIAGLPSTPDDADLVVTALPSTTTSVAPSSTVAPTTTVPTPTTTVPPTSTTGATTSTTSTSTTVALRERAGLQVGVANATDQTGVAGNMAAELQALGYANVSPADTAPADTSTVFYAAGLEGEAARLAVDAGLAATAIAPDDDAPELATPAQFELLLVIGLDQV